MEILGADDTTNVLRIDDGNHQSSLSFAGNNDSHIAPKEIGERVFTW